MRGLACLLAVLLVAVALPGPVAALGAGDGATGRASPDWGTYHTYSEMVSELQNITIAHPDITKLIALRPTYDNRTVWAVKLSDNVSSDEAEPNITILGGIHAREFIGVEVPLFILEYLVNNYSSNASVKRLVDGSQMWFLPMLNPDGHAYVEQTGDWRKNRQPYTGGIGVDLNRNFGHLWGAEASHDPAAEDFCGPRAFSENETQAVMELALAHPMTAAVSYHSGYAAILYPWGNSIDQTAVDPRLPSLAQNMSSAMPPARRLMPRMAREMYPATGDTDDWFYANQSVLAFTIELSTVYRPLEDQVAQICADNLPAALGLMDFCVPRHDISLKADVPDFSALPGGLQNINLSITNGGNLDEPLSVSASCNISWNMTILPERLTVPAQMTATVRLTVAIPGGAPAFQRCGIDVLAACDSGARANVSLAGTVGQLHRLEITLAAPDDVLPDTLVAVNVSVNNAGNGRESLSLAASTRNNWALAPPALPFLLNLSAGEAGNMTLNIVVPPDAIAGPTGLVHFKATTADALYQANGSKVLTVLPSRDLRLTASQSRLTLKVGERLNITLKLLNRGNVWENGTLNISGDFRLATLETASLNITPFSNRTVILSVEGKRPGGNLTVRFVSSTEGPNLEQSINVSVAANATNDTEPVPLAHAILVLAIATMALVAVVAFIMWDLGRHEKSERMERDRYESIAARRPKDAQLPVPPRGKVNGKGP